MKRIILVFVLAYIGIAGCAHPPFKKPSAADTAGSRVLADKLLGGIVSSYISYFREEFSRLIAEDFVPLKSEFLNEAEKEFYSADILEINYIIDEVFRDNDNLVVVFKWEKKFVPYTSPESVLSTGKADFVFRKKDTRWLLYQVKGDNPF